MSRRSVAYEAARSEVLSSVVEPAEREIESVLGEAGLALDAALHRRLRLDQAIGQAVSESRAIAGQARQDLSGRANAVASQAKDVARDAHRALEDVAVGVLQEASATDVSSMTDNAFTLLRNSLEGRVRSMAAAQVEELNAISEQLRAVAWSSEGDGNDRISGSSDIRWGSWGESAGGEEHAEPVVVAVAEAAGEAAVQFDDPVHRLSAAVR